MNNIQFRAIFLLFAIMSTYTLNDPYSILGIPNTATKTSIKKAFKELSLKYHPDINPEHKSKYESIILAY